MEAAEDVVTVTLGQSATGSPAVVGEEIFPVIHEGLGGLLTTKGEDLFNFGFSELAYRYTTGRMFDEILDEVDKQKEIKYRDNVIEVDFGKDK